MGTRAQTHDDPTGLPSARDRQYRRGHIRTHAPDLCIPGCLEELAKESEGKTFRQIPDAEQEGVSRQDKRALLGVGRAFHAGRLTVVDADCYEAMGEALNDFAKLQAALEGTTN